MASTAGRWLMAALMILAATSGSAAARRLATATGCPHPSIPVPRHEPKYTPGTAELISGLYVQGGAVPPPPCHPEPRGPYAGKLTITNQSGTFTATQTVKAGHLAHIRLAPGQYQLSGEMAGGGRTVTADFTVKAGQRVRQDAFEDVP